jgi:hypothetical protein
MLHLNIVILIFFKSIIMPSSYLYLGLPTVLFPMDFHLITLFISLWVSILTTCPNQYIVNDLM